MVQLAVAHPSYTTSHEDVILINQPSLARKLDRTESTVRRWRKSGIIPPPDKTIHDRPYWYSSTLHEVFPGLF